MSRFALLAVIAGAASIAQPVLADDTPAIAALRAACATDAQTVCAGVPASGGKMLACLKEHKDTVSDGCRQAAGLPPKPVKTPDPASSSARSAASTAPVAAAAKGAASGSFLRMKQVQVALHIDGPPPDPNDTSVNSRDPKDTAKYPRAVPWLNMLIPSTWEFKSSVVFNAESGCIADHFSVAWSARSADGSVAFNGAPDRSWQYADDPATLHNLTDPNRRQINIPPDGKIRTCPVKKPIKAEDYLRQNLLPELPSGIKVVSVEPFPELNQIARRQLGLPADDAGKDVNYKTDAIRARLEFQKDGKAREDWVTLVIFTRVFRQGRGNFYDSHMMDLMSLDAPKGSLDANDKLFKVMISSLQLDPQGKVYANDWLGWRYNVEAKKQATIDAIWARFQNQVARTIMEETLKQQRGSIAAASGTDQLMRGVQTFRNPVTGSRMELSNQYDHAWLNGSNEYIMSDDPNFNPSQLPGSWNELQLVRPAP